MIAVLLAAGALLAETAAGGGILPVPVFAQSPEHCGPAALAMVMTYYGADSTACAEAARAYQPELRGALITDLAAAARRAGFRAEVIAPPPDSLAAWLARGVPPILLYQSGVGPVSRGHYGVLVGWDRPRGRCTLNDGGAKRRETAAASLLHAWRAAGGQALIVQRAAP